MYVIREADGRLRGPLRLIEEEEEEAGETFNETSNTYTFKTKNIKIKNKFTTSSCIQHDREEGK